MTERYRRQTEELRAKQEYDEERDRTTRPREESQVYGTAMPKPWEGVTETAKAFGIDLSQLWQTREQELSLARQTADEKEKELHELRLREIDRRVEDLQKLAATTSYNLQGGNGNQGGHRSRMDEAIDNLIASRMESFFGGNNQQQLTAEDIKQIASKAVQEGTQHQQTPQQIVNDLMGYITAAETAKKKMAEISGGGQPNGNYLTQAGSMRSDVLKILLENDRETLKLNHDYDIQKERNKHLGGLAGTVRDNFEDLIGASRDIVKDHRESGNKRQEDHKGGYQVKCSLCGEVSTFQEKPGPVFECPYCDSKLRLQDSPQSPPGWMAGSTRLEI